MKASELRVGNKLYRGNQIVTVKRLILEDDDILICEESGLFTLGYTVQPIPLTLEILEKCGFEYIPELFEYADKNHTIYETINRMWSISIFCNNDCRVNLQYLHQLQNLFYALTGEELNYQP